MRNIPTFSGRIIVFISIAVYVCSPPARAQSTPATTQPRDDYQLIWADEFNTDGPVLPKDWGFENGFVRNRELQWYQPDNASCKDGFLVIEARRERKPNPRYVAPATSQASDAGNPRPRGTRGNGRAGGWQNRETIEFTSASLNTRGKHAWLFGRFEVRAKIDVRAGSWPAFWTLGVQGPWPANGEVDIMEYYDQMVLANIAWAGKPSGNDGAGTWNAKRLPLSNFPKDWADKFHTWRMDWDADSMKIYLDDALVNAQDLHETINTPARNQPTTQPSTGTNPFHAPAYILLNQAIGGTRGGDPTATEFPLRFLVDYVRVWQTPSQIEAAKKLSNNAAQ